MTTDDVPQYPRYGLPEYLPLPRYRTPRNTFALITGQAADDWPNPHVIEVDGRVYVEWPLDGNWGISFQHAPSIWRDRGFVSVFVHQYAEGMASGFPRWAVIVFALKTALRILRPVSQIRYEEDQ